MPGLDLLLTFYAASFVLALAPGPDIIFVLTQSALFGTSAGLITTAGLLSGVFVHTFAVALGVAVIFQTSHLAFTLLKCLGAGYLCWLAWLALRAGATLANVPGGARFIGYKALFCRGIIMNVTNPKVALFFLAFLPQFCDPSKGEVGWQIVLLGGIFILSAIPVFCMASLLGGRLEKKFNDSPKIQIAMHRIAGIIYLGLALALVLTKNI